VGAVNSIAADQPSLVFIELGGNESYTDVDPAVYQANLEQLTSAIWSVSPRSTLVYETIWPFDPRAVTNPVHTWDQYATAMWKVAVNHAAGWIDQRQFFPAHYADDANTHLLNTDQIHPTDAGNAVEYTAILTILNGC
jgi:lysophospholipase L1-like esterase